jgi:hypothetical protein
VGRRWLLVGSFAEFWEVLMCEVGACAAAGKLPPPGWTKPDENGKGISVSDVARFGESMLS